MVAARRRFLGDGCFEAVRQAVADQASATAPERGTLVDAGCGTGYYLAGVLDRLPGFWGLGWTPPRPRCVQRLGRTSVPQRLPRTSLVRSRWQARSPTSSWSFSRRATLPSSAGFSARQVG